MAQEKADNDGNDLMNVENELIRRMRAGEGKAPHVPPCMRRNAPYPYIPDGVGDCPLGVDHYNENGEAVKERCNFHDLGGEYAPFVKYFGCPDCKRVYRDMLKDICNGPHSHLHARPTLPVTSPGSIPTMMMVDNEDMDSRKIIEYFGSSMTPFQTPMHLPQDDMEPFTKFGDVPFPDTSQPSWLDKGRSERTDKYRETSHSLLRKEIGTLVTKLLDVIGVKDGRSAVNFVNDVETPTPIPAEAHEKAMDRMNKINSLARMLSKLKAKMENIAALYVSAIIATECFEDGNGPRILSQHIIRIILTTQHSLQIAGFVDIEQEIVWNMQDDSQESEKRANDCRKLIKPWYELMKSASE